MRNNTRKYNSRGVALVEVIAALGIAVVVITSLVSLSVFTLRSSLQSKLQLESTKVANKQMEMVRAYRDSTDWVTFYDAVNGCTGDLANNAFCHIDYDGTTDTWSVGSGDDTVGGGVETIKINFMAYAQPTGGARATLGATGTTVKLDIKASYISAGTEEKETHLYSELTKWFTQ